jgi:hypothetical protein
MHTHEASLLILMALGALHGINPAMGWLFAVSLGLQEQRRGAVWSALLPLALGHAIAIGVVVALAAVLGFAVPVATLKWIAAAALLGFGLLQLTGHRHPRLAGMKVGSRDLTVWSFLMASAHGAGLMALPFVLREGGADADAVIGGHQAAHGLAHPDLARSAPIPGAEEVADQVLMAALPAVDLTTLAATLVHTAGYLLVAGAIAILVYDRLGLRLLRTAWINLNVIWAVALIVTAVLTPLL